MRIQPEGTGTCENIRKDGLEVKATQERETAGRKLAQRPKKRNATEEPEATNTLRN